jgi:putative toxin-antitoxin system antitoxin component (TIGR02293 family)
MSSRPPSLETLVSPAILALLGGPRVIDRPSRRGPAHRGSGVASSFRLKYAAVENLGEFLGESAVALMRFIEANERTAQRRKEQGTLTPEESDRIARIARVTQRAIEAFGNKAQAREWLTRSNRALQGFAPLGLLATDAGTTLVTDELGRIEHGDLY